MLCGCTSNAQHTPREGENRPEPNASPGRMKGFVRNIKRKFSTKDGTAPSPSRSSSQLQKSDSSEERKSNGAKGVGADTTSSSNSNSDRRKNRKKASAAADNGTGGGVGIVGAAARNGGGTKMTLTPQVLNAQFTKKDLLTSLPSFRECIAAEKESLLIKKLKMCCVIFDFTDESSQENIGKEMKRQILLELVDYISTTKNWFTESVLVAVIEMISANLFRTLAPQTAQIYDGEEEEPVLDSAWSHLQIVYEFLLRFIVSTDTDAKLVKKSINGPFVLNLLELFNSEDPRERDYLKTILHRIYGKFMSLRSFVRRSINHTFYRVIYEIERHNGVGELLEILGSIINGFALPLKVEHKRFLHNVLIPLHKVRSLSTFHQQLAYCISQFIDKDPKVSPSVIDGLLSFWPMTNSSKEVLFLNELEEVLELTQQEEFEQVMGHLFKRIALCIGSPHFQVAERALFLWNNEYIAMMTTDNARALLPILYPPLHRNSKSHWNTTVHSLTFNIIKLFSELDEAHFNQCRKNFEETDELQSSQLEERRKLWSGIEDLAKKNPNCAVATDLLEESSSRSSSSSIKGRLSTNSMSSASSRVSVSPSSNKNGVSKEPNSQRASSSQNTSTSSHNKNTPVLIPDKKTEKELPDDDDDGGPVERKSQSVSRKLSLEEINSSKESPPSPKSPQERSLSSKSPPDMAQGASASLSAPPPVTLQKHSESSNKDSAQNDALQPRPLSPQVNDFPAKSSSSPTKSSVLDSKLKSRADADPTPPTVVETSVSKAVTLGSEKNADSIPSTSS